MKKVAEWANVSVATVSRVINNSGYVSEDLRERVQDAMLSLNYHPSELARSLRRQETRSIGVLIPQLDHPFFAALAFAIETALFSAEYRVLICSAQEDADKEAAYAEMLMRQRVDGVIVVPTGHSAATIEQFLERGLAVVLVDRDLPQLSVNKVLVNNFRGGYDGMAHLLQLGHQRIAVIGALAYSAAMRQRLEGIERAYAEADVSAQIEWLMDDTLQQFDMGFQLAHDLLRQPNPPTAIFALTDVAAVGVMHAAASLGLRLPTDLSIVGFDDIPLARFMIPELTTIAQPIYEMGTLSARLLIQRLTKPHKAAETVMLEPRLVLRHSTTSPGGSLNP